MRTQSVISKLLLGLAIAAFAEPPHAGVGPRKVRLAGIEDDSASRSASAMVEQAYQRIGVAAVSDFLPAERAVNVLNAGQYDGDVFHVAGIEQRYPNLVRVPVPIMVFEITPFALQPGLQINSWNDLKGRSVCIRRGIKLIEDHLQEFSNVYSVNRYGNIFDMLKVGRCQVAVVPRTAWQESNDARSAGLHEAGPVLETVDLYHYVHKSHADDVPALARALTQVRRDSFYARALKKDERIKRGGTTKAIHLR